jgi:hypothetical protein
MMQLQTLCTVSLQLVFNGCLPAKRELLHSHYAWAGTEKIAHHRQMADKLGCRQMRYETGCFGARAGQSASRHIAMPATGWEEMLVRMQRLNFVRILRR